MQDNSSHRESKGHEVNVSGYSDEVLVNKCIALVGRRAVHLHTVLSEGCRYPRPVGLCVEGECDVVILLIGNSNREVLVLFVV